MRELRIAHNILSADQREDLARLFVEAKWVANSALAIERLDLAHLGDLNGHVPVRLPDKTFEARPLQVLGDQLAQASAPSCART